MPKEHSTEEIKALLEEAMKPKRDADADVKDHNGQTELHRAVSIASSFGSFKNNVAEVLEKGADVNAKDNEGRTSLHIASRFGSREVIAGTYFKWCCCE